MSGRRRLSRIIVAIARRLGGPGSRDLVDALEAEMPWVDDRHVVRWAAGSIRVAWVRGSARGNVAYAAALAGSVVGFVAADQLLVEQQWAMLVLLATSCALGAMRPRLAPLAGVVVGSSLAVWHLALLAAGVPLPYGMEPPGLAGAASLLLLAIPGAVAALGGRLLRDADGERTRG